MGRAYKPEKSPFYSIFARQLYNGWLLFSRMALSHPSTLINIQAHSNNKQMANELKNLSTCCVFENCFEVLPSHMKVLSAHCRESHVTSRDTPPLLILVATIGKHKQVSDLRFFYLNGLKPSRARITIIIPHGILGIGIVLLPIILVYVQLRSIKGM